MCDVKNCRSDEIILIYYGHKVCQKCWESHCTGSKNLKELFNIKE